MDLCSLKNEQKACPEGKGLSRLSKRRKPFFEDVRTNGVIKRIQQQTASLLAPSLRHEQLQEVSSADTSISEADQVANRNLKLALSSLAITTTGALIYSPLSLASVPLLLYLHIPDFKESSHVLFKERKITSVIVDTVLTSGLLISGQYLACALTSSFFMLSKKLLVKVEDHSLNSLVNLFGKQPRFVWLLSDGVDVQIPFDDLQVSDTIVVHAGEMIPADGTITDGMASIDQRMLTGEAQPAEKGCWRASSGLNDPAFWPNSHQSRESRL